MAQTISMVPRLEHEVEDYPGLASHPFTWEDAVQKFDALVAGRIDNNPSGEIKNAVRSVENIRVRDLMNLLGHVGQASGIIRSEPSRLATSNVTATATAD